MASLVIVMILLQWEYSGYYLVQISVVTTKTPSSSDFHWPKRAVELGCSIVYHPLNLV